MRFLVMWLNSRRTPLKYVLVAILAAVILAWGEYRVLWGYWSFPPRSLVAGMSCDTIKGISHFKSPDGSQLIPDTALSDVAHLCGVDKLTECEEGQALLALSRNLKTPHVSSGVDATLLTLISERLTSDRHEAGTAGKGTPTGGTAIQFSSGGTDYIWMSYYTREIQNDWHQKVQWLYGFPNGKPRLDRVAVYRYEIAGLEGIPSWLLAIFNAVVALAGLAGARLREDRQTWKRYVGTLLASGLAAIGIGLGWLVLSAIHAEDPWLVVLVLSSVFALTAGISVFLKVVCRPARS